MSRKNLYRAAFVQSWLATMAFGGFLTTVASNGSQLVAGGAILLAAILAMNGLARTDMFLAGGGPRWWYKFPIFGFFHRITNEGELAGIAVGIAAGGTILWWGQSLHIPWGECFTLLGIMSAANIAVRHMIPIMGFLERIGDMRLVIAGGSLLSSLTGEPAAAVFLCDYVKTRIDSEEDKKRVAVGLAATIGSGGGLTFFAAPPILIVWSKLEASFGWGITDLIAWVGVGCVLHVTLTTFRFYQHVGKNVEFSNNQPRLSRESIKPLAILVSIVIAHILAAIFKPSQVWIGLLWAADSAAAVYSYLLAHAKYADVDQDDQHALEEAFTARWQPLILAVLLAALELIGVVAEPLIIWIGQKVLVLSVMMPKAIALYVLALMMFFLSAVTSHFADNALASRVYIIIPMSLIKSLGLGPATLLATAVVQGALFGGLLTVPANLPNFYISRALGVGPGPWIRTSWRLYWTCIAYLAWLTVRFVIL
ncbi:DUF1646 family protein [Patescibacteria group bacterium]|nr:DUF1646 family protein [Patescibacteria group bacterium]